MHHSQHRAYYNEYDPRAAQWLRNLIDADLIAPGDVDERSISDVNPSDLDGYTQCHFFAGIGGWSHALRISGWPDERAVWTGSCPCQPFSAAGKRGGVDDERHLWPAFHHLIRECRPPVVFGEQVASKDGLGWLELVHTDLEGEGYAVAAYDLCAAGVGAPHIRQRLYWVGHADNAGLSLCKPFAVAGTWRGQQGRAAQQSSRPCERLGDTKGLGRQPGPSDASIDGARVESSWSIAIQSSTSGEDATGGLEHTESDGRLERRSESVRRSAPGGRSVEWLADTGGSGYPQLGGEWFESAGPTPHCSTGRLADTYGGQRRGLSMREGCVADWETSGWDQGNRGTESGSSTGGLADTDGRYPGAEGVQRGGQHGLVPGDNGPAGGMDNTDALGRQPGWYGDHTGDEWLVPAPAGSVAAPGHLDDGERTSPLHGFWGNADWLLCRDGKWRPVASGTFPLAHGVPNRVAALRGAGNAIVPQVAQVLIEAYLELEQQHTTT